MIYMSIVIIGGHERMASQYDSICKEYGHDAKIFTKENGKISKKFGTPDLMILFTNTVSHKMVHSALQVSKKNNIPVERIHSSSACSLKSVFENLAVNN
jgi:hypothetical protein